jgi:hypothetical protein
VGAFADTLKKYGKGGTGHRQNHQNSPNDFLEVPYEAPKEPKKPTFSSSLGLLGTASGTLENIFSPNSTDTKKPDEGGSLGLLGEASGTFEKNISPEAPAIESTHRTTVDLIFNDPEAGTVRTLPAGTLCRRFSSPTSALMAGVPLDFAGNWAAAKNIERGYSLIWLEGMLRGVHFSDIEPLKGTQND